MSPLPRKTKGKVERFNRYLKESFVVPLATTFKQSGLMLDIDSANARVGELKGYLSRIIHKPRLLVVDEISYLPFGKEEANLFFQVVARRYESGCLVLTSNLPFTQWSGTFNGSNAGSPFTSCSYRAD